jgi:hypothetical protein
VADNTEQKNNETRKTIIPDLGEPKVYMVDMQQK